MCCHKLPRTLYIIGNGFDIHHGLESSYKHYLYWLQDNDPNLYKSIIELYPEAEDDEWWGDFETHLGCFDLREIVENAAKRSQPNEDDIERCRSIDTNGGAYLISSEVGSILNQIKGTFHEWVNTIEKAISDGDLIELVPDAVFLNFNYTRTLEKRYEIPEDKVFHIHGTLNQEYILGHHRDIQEIKDGVEPYIPPFDPDKDDPSEYGIEALEDDITENAKQEAIDQAMYIRKDVEGIIEKNKAYFSSLKKVKKVYILGLSFSNVDSKYLETVFSHVRKNARYIVSYYSKRDYDNIKSFMDSHNIQCELIKLASLTIYKQLELSL